MSAAPAPQNTPQDTGGFIYIPNSNENTISQARVTASGRLVPLVPPQVTAGNHPIFVDLSPDGRFAYAINDNDNSISQYEVSADGRLKALVPPTVPTGSGLVRHLCFSANGRYAYDANAFDSTISQYRVGTDGALSPLEPPDVRNLLEPEEIYVAPGGRFLFTVNGGAPVIASFRITANGRLSPLHTTPIHGAGHGGPFYADSLVFSRDGRYLYAAYAHAHQEKWTIGEYRVERDGALAVLGAAQSNLLGTSYLHLSPDGHTLFTTGGPRLYQFHLQPDGRLKPLRPPFLSVPGLSLGLTFLGDFMYTNVAFRGSVFQFRLNPGGGASPLVPSEVSSAGTPEDILANGAAHAAYVPDQGMEAVFQYRVGPDGRLSPLTPPIFPVGTGPSSIRPLA